MNAIEIKKIIPYKFMQILKLKFFIRCAAWDACRVLIDAEMYCWSYNSANKNPMARTGLVF